MGSRNVNAPFTPVPRKMYRGSRKRLRRITFRGNSSTLFWIFIIVFLLTLFVLVPWLVQHPPRLFHD
jgi:uncharacterized membrane protein YjgN (DUF898 family)